MLNGSSQKYGQRNKKDIPNLFEKIILIIHTNLSNITNKNEIMLYIIPSSLKNGKIFVPFHNCIACYGKFRKDILKEV